MTRSYVSRSQRKLRTTHGNGDWSQRNIWGNSMQRTLTVSSIIEKAKKIDAIREDMKRVQDAKMGKPIEVRYYKLCADFVQELAKGGPNGGAENA